jgi:LPS-assembly protein
MAAFVTSRWTGSWRIAGCGGLLALVLGQALDRAAAQDFGAGPVLMLANEVKVDAERKVITAEGEVDVTRGDRRLLADRIRYDQVADRIEAIGNVTLLEPTGEAIFAERLDLSGDLKDGVARQLQARIERESRFAAAEGRRVAGNRTEMEQAIYSPCPLCPDSDRPPLWQLRAAEVSHDQADKKVTYKHAFFELFGVPLLYTPYFSHPDPTVKRKSGLLAPTFGNDSELGFTFELPYYFALAPNYDLTLTPIITTKEGPVLGGEWRHQTTRGRYELAGSITYGTESERNVGDEVDDKAPRGHIVGDGRFGLGGGWAAGYDVFVASDDTYLERYGFSDEDILENRLYGERIWGRNYAAINGYGFQGLRQDDDQGLIPIVLPLAELNLESQPLWGGLRTFMDTSALLLTRTDGLDTHRYSTTAGMRLPWLGLIGDQFTLTTSLRGDYYQIDGDPITLEDNGSSEESRIIPSASLAWSWPWIGQSFGYSSVIEPVAVLNWAPTGTNDDDIPNEDSLDFEFDDTNLFEPSRFPGIDRIEEGASVSYGLRYGVVGASGEVFNALFGEIYRFQEDEQFDAESGLDGNFSDFVGRLELTPASWFSSRYRFRLDRDSLAPLRNEVRAVIGPSWLRFDGTYLSLDADPEVAADEFEEREELTTGILIGLGPSLSFRAQTRRDLETSSTISNIFGLIYRNPCLLLIGGLEQDFTQDRDADGGTTVSVRITFQNLGEIGGEASLPGL